MDEFKRWLVLSGHMRQHKISENGHVGDNIWVVVLFIEIISHIHLIEVKQLTNTEIPSTLRCESKGANPVEDTWSEKNNVTFNLIECDNRNFVCQAEVNVTEP